jgi:predicted alpha/beta superfamily hydrolase
MHKAILILIVICFGKFAGFSQVRITLSVSRLPEIQAGEKLFVAGSFNAWNPQDIAYQLSNQGNSFKVTISVPPNTKIDFKFTRGSWASVECSAYGSDLPNRTIPALTSDTLVSCEIMGWKDQWIPGLAMHTASKQVKFIDSAFTITELKRQHLISLYLPKQYDLSSERYPVIYMLDGQNLFDAYGTFAGEWEVDETLDSLLEKGIPGVIIVAIHTDQHRMCEYSPFVFKYCEKPEAAALLHFITQSLKPYIDGHYRTKKEKESTGIAGSSLGGLFAYYAWLNKPEVFGNAGIFSPSFWIGTAELEQQTDKLAYLQNGKAFFYMGEKEDGDDLGKMKSIADRFAKNSKAKVNRIIDPNGAHNETYWKKWFAEFYLWIIRRN